MDIPEGLKCDVLGAVFDGRPARAVYYNLGKFKSRKKAERFLGIYVIRIDEACTPDEADIVGCKNGTYALRLHRPVVIPLQLDLGERVAQLFMAHGLERPVLPCVDFQKGEAYTTEENRRIVELAQMTYKPI